MFGNQTSAQTAQLMAGDYAGVGATGRESDAMLNEMAKRIEFLFMKSSQLHMTATRICGSRPEPATNGEKIAESSAPSLAAKLRVLDAGLSRLCNEIEDSANRLDAFA